jgi:hypothetical protein
MTKRPQGSRRTGNLTHILALKIKPRPSSKRLASVSHETLRRASPAENVRMDFPPTARRYVKADVKRVTKTTASVSARQAETKRVRKVHGVSSLEQATRERQANNIPYSSPRAAQTARKSKDDAYFKRLRKAGKDHRRIVGEFDRKRRHSFQASPEKVSRAEKLRKRKLRGEFIEDQGEWFMMIRFAEDLGDPALHILRSSLNSDRGAEYDDE